MSANPIVPLRVQRELPALLIEGQVHAVPLSGLVVGRGPRCDVRVSASAGNDCHCRITWTREDQLVVTPLATGRLALNGQPLEGPTTLRLDDVFFAGEMPVVVVAAHISKRYPQAVRWGEMVGRAQRSLDLFDLVARLAASDMPLWLHGESGTGKELAARAVHRASDRAAGPWVALSCASLPDSIAEAELFGVKRGAFTGADRSRDGAFVRADGGTLFLDEVAELSPAVQAALLRVLETGEVLPVGGDGPIKVNVRIIVATWRDLEQAAAEGAFRFDLLQRIDVLRIHLPPLRERPADVGPIVEMLLRAAGADRLWPGHVFMQTLERAPWRGNVRELRNHVARTVAHNSTLQLLPKDGLVPASPLLPRRSSRYRYVGQAVIRRTLAAHGHNRTACARALGVSRSTLYRWLAEVA